MKIAVLGWGSLIWDPQELRVKTEWFEDGPLLPIEFARISNNGRLTLIIKDGFDDQQVLWSLMDFESTEEAIENLRVREATSTKRIGVIDLVTDTRLTKNNFIVENIQDWAIEKNIDSVIWTDLGMKFRDKIKTPFSNDNAIAYLESLEAGSFQLAKDYILNAPDQIDTSFRRKFSLHFNA